MKKLNRREFITKAAMGTGAALALSQLPTELFANAGVNDIPVGFQSWTIKDQLSKDFAGTLKSMSAQGYKLIEMCSPKGYATIGFGAFVDMKPADMRKIINDAGLTCPSCHFGSAELFDDVDGRIEWAQQLGLTQMICSTFWLPKTATLKDYQDAAGKLNKSGEKIKKAGIQAGFHNHEFEFAMFEG